MRDRKTITADILAVEAERTAYSLETNRLIETVKRDRYDGLRALEQRRHALHAERRDVEDAEALTNPHPWDGRKVTRIARRPKDRWSRLMVETRLYGIVETVTHKTKWPGNIGDYRHPDVGGAIVRPLTKSGKPGLLFEKLTPAPEGIERADEYWHLVEGDA